MGLGSWLDSGYVPRPLFSIRLDFSERACVVPSQRVQNAILDGTTSKADLQPLIDDFFPPAPLPPSFLTSDTSPLSSERRQEVENTVLRTRRTCQALRKKAALIAKSHAGTPKRFVLLTHTCSNSGY